MAPPLSLCYRDSICRSTRCHAFGNEKAPAQGRGSTIGRCGAAGYAAGQGPSMIGPQPHACPPWPVRYVAHVRILAVGVVSVAAESLAHRVSQPQTAHTGALA